MTFLCTWFKIGCTAGLISGSAYVHDGDTIYVSNQAIRLYGVDAEELDEPHGIAAREHLKALTDGWFITCHWEGWSYKRRVGVCHYGTDNADGRFTASLNARMVSDGYALDCAHYSNGLYRSLEPAGARSRLIQKGYC